MSEFNIIDKYFKPLATKGAPSFSLTNDAAVYSPVPGKDLVFTNDTLVSNIHFFENDNPYFVAQKSLRVNLSDLAAMGAEPRGYLLSLSLPKKEFEREKWLELFSDGLRNDQEKYQCFLWGGDTVSTDGPLTVSITAIGDLERGKFASRSSAAPGDDIYVSGVLGDAAVGLELLKNNIECDDEQYFKGKYYLPEPRLELGVKLIPSVSSMMDISDGLMGDIAHICDHSRVGAKIFEEKIPISAAFSNLLETKSEYNHLKWSGGDDYELLFTASTENKKLITDLSEALALKVTKIGEIIEGSEAVLIGGDGSRLDYKDTGFRHF